MRFSEHAFLKVFTMSLEHQSPQASPKTAKKAPKTAPGSLHEPFKKGQLVYFVFQQKVVPKTALQNCKTYVAKQIQKRIPKTTKSGPRLFQCVWDPKRGRKLDSKID